MRLPLFASRLRPWWELWLIAGLIYLAIVVSNTTVIVSNRFNGFQFGLFIGFTTLPGFLAFALAWILAVVGLWRWRGWSTGWRSVAALGPFLLIALLDVTASSADLFSPQLRFGPEYGADLPPDAHDFRAFFSQMQYGLNAMDCFAFESNPLEIKRLLAAHEFKEVPTGLTPAREAALLEQVGARQFPDLRTWPGVKVHEYLDPGKQFAIVLLTDETMTKVFIKMSAF